MRKKILFVLILLIFFFAGSVKMVYAGNDERDCFCDGVNYGPKTVVECVPFCRGIKKANTSSPNTLADPLGGATPQIMIGKIISATLGIVGSLALIMFIYGGFTWMLSAGNAEIVTKGKNILIWATIGLIIIFTSYALVKFVFKGIGVL